MECDKLLSQKVTSVSNIDEINDNTNDVERNDNEYNEYNEYNERNDIKEIEEMKKQEEDEKTINDNVLDFNDPTLLIANITAHNYLKTIKKHQDKKAIDPNEEFYNSIDFSNNKQEITNILTLLIDNKFEEYSLKNKFRLLCNDIMYYIKTQQLRENQQNIEDN